MKGGGEMARQFRSSFSHRLYTMQIAIKPYEANCSTSYLLLDPEPLGIVIRLLPYILAVKTTEDFRILSRYCRVHPKTLRKWWPQIMEHALQKDEDGFLALRDLNWLLVQTVSAERQDLRHLMSRLIAHWGSACVYCGADSGSLHIEHIVPLARGGSDDLSNLTLACGACNSRKGKKTASEFGFPHIHEMASRIQ